MKGKNRRKQEKKRSKHLLIAAGVIGTVSIGTAVYVIGFSGKGIVFTSPGKLLVEYMNHIPEQEYDEMYAMLDIETLENINQEDFIKRNADIYEGIEVLNMTIDVTAYNEEEKTVSYHTSFDTVVGNISFENEAFFLKEEDGYKLAWDDSLIFPELSATDNVRVSTTQATRGEILDRKGNILAGKGVANSIGMVPGKMKDRDETIQQVANLLELEPQAKVVKDKERYERLLEIPGVMSSDIEVREYPLSEAAAHLIGYVQSITEEDLEEHAGEGYTPSSMIGRSGMEGLFELEGIKKVINDANGTGYAAHRDDIVLAGKTGTAEIKASKEDVSGTELGWFAIFTAEKTQEHPILIISMAEDVKERGSSGYVVEKDKLVLEDWFHTD